MFTDAVTGLRISQGALVRQRFGSQASRTIRHVPEASGPKGGRDTVRDWCLRRTGRTGRPRRPPGDRTAARSRPEGSYPAALNPRTSNPTTASNSSSMPGDVHSRA